MRKAREYFVQKLKGDLLSSVNTFHKKSSYTEEEKRFLTIGVLSCLLHQFIDEDELIMKRVMKQIKRSASSFKESDDR